MIDIRCAECGTVSSHREFFVDLSVTLPPDAVSALPPAALQSLLAAMFEPEPLTGANRFACTVCERLTDAQRVQRVAVAPRVLIVTLLRFAYDAKVCSYFYRPPAHPRRLIFL
jgi:ubiquitin C-terminal hydrolase